MWLYTACLLAVMPAFIEAALIEDNSLNNCDGAVSLPNFLNGGSHTVMLNIINWGNSHPNLNLNPNPNLNANPNR